MKMDFIVTVPMNVYKTNFGIEFYDKVKIVQCSADNEKEIYQLYPNAINVEQKDA